MSQFIKGFAAHSNGKKHPIHEKKGIKESDLNISVKGNNDRIEVGKSIKGMKGNREFTGYNHDDDAFNHYHRKLEADYFEYKGLQEKTKLPSLNLEEYKTAYGFWDKLPEEKRRNVLATVTGREPSKIKFVNYKFNDLSHNEQQACLVLSRNKDGDKHIEVDPKMRGDLNNLGRYFRYKNKPVEITSIADVKKLAEKRHSHFFDADTMRFFQSRPSEEAYKFGDKIYFITSEKGPSGIRKFTTRYIKEDGDIDTLGQFQAYGSLLDARREIRDFIEKN